MNKLKKLKRAVIKEELVALTGDFVNAVVLNQLIYWSERVSDFDEFIKQEKARAEKHGEDINIDTTCGWIYKTAEELSAETMLNISKQNMRLHLKELVNLGYIQERENPKYKWDKTKQYRVNITKIQKDLKEIGYCLDGYPQVLECDTEVYKNKLRENNLEHQVNNLEHQSEQIVTAIPEIITEITTELFNTRTQKNEKKAPPTQKQQYISYKEKERIEQEKKAANFKKHTGAPINFEGDLNDWYSKTMDTFA